jgi:hypothetical protein
MSRVWLTILALLPLWARAAEGPSKPGADGLRRLHVPFEEVKRILAGSPNAVLLPQASYEAMVKAAELRSRSSNPPQSTVLGSAECEIELRGREASFTATLKIASLAAGVHAVPLRTDGIDLLAASADGKPAALWRDGGQLYVLVDGAGDHVVTLAGLLPVDTDAARQTLHFALPEATATRLRLRAPGDVEVKAGAAELRREYVVAEDRTHLELVPTRQAMDVVLSRNNRQRQSDAVVDAHSVVLVGVGEQGDDMFATVSLDIPHGSIRQARFSLPTAVSITSVEGDDVAQWSTDETELEVVFRGDVTGGTELRIVGLRTGRGLEDWRLPVPQPLDVQSNSAVYGLLLDDRLETRGIQTTGLMPVQAPAEMARRLGVVGGNARPVAFYYAPQGSVDARVRIVKPEAAFRVGGNQLLTLADAGASLLASFVVSPEYERVFWVDVLLPRDWQVEQVVAGGSQLPIEMRAMGEANRLRVTFPEGAKLGAETGFSVQARWVPTDWLGAWDRREVSFPDVRIAGAREETGVLAVVGKDDFEVVPKAPQGLVPLDQQERARYGLQNVESRAIFRYEAPGYALGVDVVRKMPRLRGESLSFFVVGEDHLRAHYELLYQVDRARVRQLQFALPGNTPTALSVSGIGQTPVKEYSSTDQDGRRLWTVWLASPMAGAVRLGVDLQMMTPREGEADLPLPVLVGVDYQSGRLAVEGEEDLDVRVVAHPRPVDVGELAEASNYRPGARLLGTYGFVGDPEPVRVSRTRHGGYALPSVLVVRSELTSVFGTEGRGQHAAQYVLRSKLRFLDMAMPEGASLWSVLVDGTPIAPAKQDDRLLFELPENGGSAEHSLMVVYETEGSRVGMRGELSAVAPSLVLRSDDGYSVPVPVADLEWHVHLPVGFRISGTDGTVAPTQLVPVTPAALNLGLLLYRMTGGVSPQRGLVSGFLLGGLQSARQKAVESSKTAEADKRGLDRLMAEDDTLAADVPVQKPQSAPAPTPSRPTVEQGQMLGYVDSYSRDPKDAASSSWASGWSLPALKGSRSLKIALAGGEDGYLFRSLGEHPRLVVRVLNQRRLDGICRAVAVLVFCVGLLLTRKPFRRKLAYVGGVLVVAGLLPALPGLVGLALLLNSAFYAAALLVPYYVFAWLVRVVVARIGEYVVLETRAASALLVVGLLLGIDALGAPRPDAMEIVKPEPIVLPRDAIVVPYGEDGKPLPDIVVPREHFEALLQSSEPAPDPKAEKPYGVAGGTYTCVLTDTDRLQVHGKMSIEVNGDESVFVPLALRNAVFESVQLDGKPAALAFLGGNDMEVKQTAAPAESFAPVPGIVVAGKGRHELALVLWLPVGSEGGRQRVDSRLPTSGASEVRVRVPTAGVEVFRNLNHRWSSDVSQRAGEEFAAPLGRDGSFRLHWRPKTAETVLDPTLTAESTIEFGIFEDQVRVEWQVRLSFRRGERDVFTFHVPGEYVVEKVAGDNVRGWQVASAADGQTVTVTALKAAAKSESFALSLRRKGLGSMARNERVAFPALVAEGAVRHTAKLVVRHSGLQEIRVAEADASVRRTEMVAKPKTAVPSDSRPLPVRDYAAYELASLPCTLVFEVSATASRPTVLVRSIVRLSRRQRVVESRIEVSRVLRPLYGLRISVPPELEVKDVRSAVRAEWYLQGEGEGRTLTVLLPDGVQGTVALGLDGQLPGGLGDVALPRIEVLGMPEQKGEIVVQADPGLQVDPVS